MLKTRDSCDGMAGREKSTSLFGDWACGEPLTNQHLVVDFTPSDKIDTDFVQRKCCAFWDLVSNSPELRDLIVLPDSIQYNHNRSDEVSSIPPESYSSNSSVSSEPITFERTALSALEFAEEKGVVTDTFVPRLPNTCSLGPREYHKNAPTAATYSNLSLRNKACKCECTCELCKHRQPKGGASPSPEVQHLCKTMRDWDDDHPKSMEPPGRVPYLSHCLMQRNLIT